MRAAIARLLIAGLLAHCTAAAPNPGASPTTSATAAQWHEDLRSFAAAMPRTHLNLFHTTSRSAWESAVAALDARLDTLSAAQFEVELMRLVALSKDGHTQIQAPFAGTAAIPPFHEFPITLYAYSDGMFVQTAAPSYAYLAGARLLVVGRTAIADAVDRVTPLIDRDSDAMVPWYTARYLAVAEIDQALGLTDATDRGSFTFEVGGRAETIELAARAIDGHAGWIDARAAAAAPTPLYLRDPGNAYWASRIGDDTMYVQWNVVLQKPSAEESIYAFFSRVMAEIDAAAVRRLIVDERFNQGGERSYVDPVVQLIADRPALNRLGGLFVITGRRTFSSGVVFCAELQRLTHVLFVGEPASSRPNQYATIARFTLPNSKLVVGASTQYNQDADPGDQRPWIAVDLPAVLSSRDYAQNADPALAAILVWKP